MTNRSQTKIIPIAPGNPLPDLKYDAAVAPLSAEVLIRDKPNRHFLAIRNECVSARCSIWTAHTPRLDQWPVGVVGHFAAADFDTGVEILRHATERLRHAGLTHVIGPMDGNTWRSYRLVIDIGTEPPFYMEPINPPDWPAHFLAAGFCPLATYSSALNTDLSVTDARVPAALVRMQSSGICIRSIDLDRFTAELSAVHELSLESFANNYLYTPIAREEFVAMYEPLKAHLVPELVLLAEQQGRLVGFMFGLPDLLEARRGEKVRTALAKTLAVRPGRDGAGVGSVLMDLFQQSAHRLGFTRVIHSLMHESNRSRAISSRYGRPMRRYALYGGEIPQ